MYLKIIILLLCNTFYLFQLYRFYHGRTETMRTCTPEMVEFCRKMLDCDATSEDVHECLLKAHKKYKWLMRECVDNRGCDRHLFGLQIQALSVRNLFSINNCVKWVYFNVKVYIGSFINVKQLFWFFFDLE